MKFYNMETLDEQWKNKIKQASEISRKNGYPEQNEEFWIRQPAGVISLVIELSAKSAILPILGI